MAAGELWVAAGTHHLRYRDANDVVRTIAIREHGTPTHGSLYAGEIKAYNGHLVYISHADRQRRWTEPQGIYHPGRANGEIFIISSYLYVGVGTDFVYRQELA